MDRVSQILAGALKENRKNLLEPEAKAICQEYNIPVTKFKVAISEDDTVEFAEKIGYPVVLKIVSPDIIHKSDIGGVMLNLETRLEVIRAHRAIHENVKRRRPHAKITGVLVQEMAPQSTEVIVGAVKDPQFGPTIMFGLGGIFVEVLEDVAFRIAPVTKQEAKLMITEIKAYPVLKGYRSQPPSDLNAVAEVISNTSKLVMKHEKIKELDLNPMIVYEKGAKTVDARIILE